MIDPQEITKAAHAWSDKEYPESPLAPENESYAEIAALAYIVGAREQSVTCCESCRKAKALGFTPSSALLGGSNG